jgi:hypothetical protein
MWGRGQPGMGLRQVASGGPGGEARGAAGVYMGRLRMARPQLRSGTGLRRPKANLTADLSQTLLLRFVDKWRTPMINILLETAAASF